MAPVYLWPFTIIGYAILTNQLLKTQGVKQAAVQTFIFFLGFHVCGLYWVSQSLFVDFSTWWWALPFAFVGLPVACALFPTVFVSIASKSPLFKIYAIGVALGLADMARGVLFTGFPWNFPIHGFVNNGIMMSILPYIGFYVLNALIIFIAVLCALTTRSIMSSIPFIIIVIGVWCYPFNISPNDTVLPPKNTILIQANIAQKDKWNSDLMMGNFARHIEMSNAAILNNEPQTIIWPETAISQNLISYPQANEMLAQFLNALPKDSVLITGFLNSHNGDYFNSLVVFNTDGEIIARYDKHHLVPFGEYMPLGLDTITGFNGFTSGEEPSVLSIDNIRFLPLICYEIIFPKYAAQSDDSDFILNLTNDSWFGDTAGPYQHLDQARLRAIETQKSVLRLSGNGISGWIDTSGRTNKTSMLNKAFVLTY